MTVNAVPTAGNYPTRFNKREAKVIETARNGLAETADLGGYIVMYAGKHTVTAGEDTAESAAITVTGTLTTDIVFANFQVADATSVITTVVPTAGVVTVNGTLKENDVISYMVLRAMA